jgi:hypothetical protein
LPESVRANLAEINATATGRDLAKVLVLAIAAARARGAMIEV